MRVSLLSGLDDCPDHVNRRRAEAPLCDPRRLGELRDVLAYPSPTLRLVECRGDRCVHVADRLRGPSAVLECPVEVVQMLGGHTGHRNAPQPRDEHMAHVGAVRPHRRGRELHAVALLEPALEELGERDPQSVSASGSLRVDQVSNGRVSGPGRAMDRAGDLLVLAGDGVLADVDPDLPDPWSALALRSSHELNGLDRCRQDRRDRRGRRGRRKLGMELGWRPGLQKSPPRKEGSQLGLLW